ncbi:MULTISPECIES: hypothetical protein [unclassified Arsukibacterium]|uniref:hypothetical protein n=1 Tax=unclassified Arsukibacterium TaxID=2635278 RepID=UPI000C68B455|nr:MULTISPECIES: hypothetical protein [unclassified Arsukibacterium]MAA94218.1 hypothetical protein [Rheinheimera sp.]MBM34469.1 hypothetical protein [Rheinheimera sp.]HAW93979.1 hypothetical protein [Candidatus Azambacteria bacterium]|tara:strand:- start:307 stop:501 length:195 start_codon:yes stop_codon:yes gene_type:complete
MSNDGSPLTSLSSYAVWLNQARQILTEQQHLVSVSFSADNTAVSFDNISYATAKVISEQSAVQE